MLRRLFIAFIFMFFVFSKLALAAFDMSLATGYRTIDFGSMQLGEKKTISQRGGYEHQFNFTSDTGRTWYFKAQLVRPFTSGAYSIPAENFQWIVEELRDGRGSVFASLSTPNPFSSSPALIYTSADTDNTGTQVQIRLKYKLDIPSRQAAGTYTAHIRFIMVEAL